MGNDSYRIEITTQHAEHTIGIVKYIVIGEAQHAIAFRFDKPRPSRVISSGPLGIMRLAIDLDRELQAMARKIKKVRPKRHLSPKIVLLTDSIEQSPHGLLATRSISAQLAGAGDA